MQKARGPARLAADPSFFWYQPACKPGSVGHRRLAPKRYVTAIPLGQCLHIASSNQPGRPRPDIARAAFSLSRTARGAVPIRSCSRWGLPCRFRCRTRGALLPHLFTLASPKPVKGEGGRFVLCGTFPGRVVRLREEHSAGCYPAPHVDGARTFLSRGLSTVAG